MLKNNRSHENFTCIAEELYQFYKLSFQSLIIFQITFCFPNSISLIFAIFETVDELCMINYTFSQNCALDTSIFIDPFSVSIKARH